MGRKREPFDGGQCVVDSLDFENGFSGQPIVGAIAGPAFDTMAAAMCDAYGRDVTLQGPAGSPDVRRLPGHIA